MLICGSSTSAVQKVVKLLSQHFSLKDLGVVKSFLGIEITHTTEGIHLNQMAYIKDLLAKLNMQEAKGYATPMVSNLRLSKNEGHPTVDGTLYRSVVEALQYTTITRPENAFC